MIAPMEALLKSAASVVGWLVLTSFLSAAEPRYALVDFGPHTQGVDLNAAGEVVYYDADTLQAFRYADGKSTALPQPPEGAFLPIAMNDRGEIIGHDLLRKEKQTARRVSRIFVFSQGELRELTMDGLPKGVTLGRVIGIDNTGVVAALTSEQPARLCFVREGRVSALLDVAASAGQHEFTVVEQTRSNAAGVVVGSITGSHWEKKPGYTAQARDVWRGFVATERGVTDLDDFIPFAASASGRLIGRRLQPGEANLSGEPKGGPAWREGAVVREFDGPAGFARGHFSAISPGGRIVGAGETVTGSGFLWISQERHAFLFAEGEWRDLNDLLLLDGPQKPKIFHALHINDRGQILCQAIGEGGFRAVLLTSTEPPLHAAAP